jgi:hypothetical protein
MLLHDQRFLVSRRDAGRSRVVTVENEPLPPGALRVRIDRFGLSTNNVTYAALGEAFHYNKFFPAPAGVDQDEWVGLPVWGLATVIESQAPGIAEGAGIYGFLPAASHATLQPARDTTTGFCVERPHIPPEFSIYHQYALADRDPFHLPGQDDLVVVFRPLFLTGLLLADWMAVHDPQGTDTVVVSSASSKTAYGVAAALRKGPVRRQVIGLSSAKHREFAAGLGVYDRVLDYEDIAALSRDAAVVHVDIAGNGSVRAALAGHLGARLRVHLAVGITHGQKAGLAPRPAGRTELFFAPGWLIRRGRERGPEFFAELVAGWQAVMAEVGAHFEVRRGAGAEALTQAHRALVEGSTPPNVAHVLTLAP